MRLAGDPEDFLRNPHRLLFNASLLTLTLSYLVPNNTVILLGSQIFNVSGSGSSAPFSQLGPHPLPWPTLSQVEPVYGTQFEKVPIPEYLLKFWESDSFDVPFQSPGSNQFIPNDFLILPAPQNITRVPVMVELESGEC